MDIIVEQKAQVTCITLNRPAAMNAITPDMHEGLHAAFDAFAADDSQRICVVKGAGDRAFCAGSDLKTVDQQGAYPSSGYAGLIKRYDLNKPIIAAVNGLALGGGFEIALACDIIVASETASFGLPEPLAGVVALGGGLHRLPRQIGLKQAMGMILTGQRVDAIKAESLGLVNQVVAPEALDAAVATWCEAILKASPMAVRASKQTVLRGLDEPSLAQALKNQGGYPAYRDWAKSDDAREGPRAFAEKRSPKWQV
jgi:enoyl-CoA hydratase/carnithine racemase